MEKALLNTMVFLSTQQITKKGKRKSYITKWGVGKRGTGIESGLGEYDREVGEKSKTQKKKE